MVAKRTELATKERINMAEGEDRVRGEAGLKRGCGQN